MFVIRAVKLGQKGEVIGVSAVGYFEKRDGALRRVNELVERGEPYSGWNGQGSYWWVRNVEGTTRYTIVVEPKTISHSK